MDKINEQKIKDLEEELEKLSLMIKDYRNQRLSASDPSEKIRIKDKIKELDGFVEELEEKLEKLYLKKENQTTSSHLIKKNDLEGDAESELINASRLLKQKREIAYQKNNPSKTERQEIHKLEEEFSKLLRKLIYGESPTIPSSSKAVLTELSVFFEEIAFSEGKLSDLSIQKIDKIRNDKTIKNSWVDRSVIVSALTLRIIRNKKVDSKDWNLLIDFLTDFEDDIWERALSGLVLAFQYHHNKMSRYTHLMGRLGELRNTPKIQKGLTKIDSVLLNETYKSGFISEEEYTQSFFIEDSLNYFMPFYEEDNPILEEAFEKDSQREIDHSELIKELKVLPYTNAKRYSLIQALGKGELKRVKLEGETKRVVNEIFFMSKVLAPFQNIIQEYYCFAKYFPKGAAQDLFDRQQSIANTSLKSIILAEKEGLYICARAALKDKKYVTAIEYAQKGVKLDGSDTRMLKILAEVFVMQKNYLYAAKYLKFYLELEPENIVTLNNLGRVYTDLKEYNNSVKYYQKARDLAPEDATCWNNVGSAYRKLKKYEQALEHFQKAKDLNPKNDNYWYNAGAVCLDLKKYENALEYYQKAKDLNPKNAVYWNNIGTAHAYLKEYEKALEYFQKAEDLDPENVKYWCNIGFVYMSLKQYFKGLEYFQKGIKISPKDTELLQNLSLAYFSIGDFEQSEKTVKKAIKIEKQWKSFGMMGHIEFQKGDIDNAVKFYKEALDLSENIEDFMEAYNTDITIMENLNLDIELYLSLLEKLIEYWNKK